MPRVPPERDSYGTSAPIPATPVTWERYRRARAEDVTEWSRHPTRDCCAVVAMGLREGAETRFDPVFGQDQAALECEVVWRNCEHCHVSGPTLVCNRGAGFVVFWHAWPALPVVTEHRPASPYTMFESTS
jgi:hypothetical protein